jgi:alkylation response protein AidB-like acyl-CoA dehydrogenase
MNFSWSEQQLDLRQGALEFGRRQLVDRVTERDREAVFSRELWTTCAEFGLQGMLVPAELGGGGHDLLDAVAALEGLGRGAHDNGLVFSVTAHLASCVGPIAEFGSPAQKERWLPGLADGSIIGATAVTEPDAGSSALALETIAEQSGDDWIVNGTKTFVTNAPVADLFLVYARTGGTGMAGLTCFLLERETEGLKIGAPLEKMGLRTSPIAQLYLDSCRVPASSIIGTVGSGAMVFHQTMEVERLLVSAPLVGATERILERCVGHARQRSPGSVAIGSHQAISHRIADMELALESARLLLYKAAWQRMRRGAATRESALAKLAVSESYVEACRSAMQIFGGYGYMVDYELEREMRDALATTVYVGTSEIQRNLIAGLRGLG